MKGASKETIERAGELLATAERPVIMAGTDLYWGHGEQTLLELAETLRIPVFLNGLARGCVPADHELFFSRARSQALKGADVALVVGVPMDFRLGFGGSFGDDTEILVVDVAEPLRPHPRAVAAECYGALESTLSDLRVAAGAKALASEHWIAELRAAEAERREAERVELEDDRAPLHPMRLYAELGSMLDRDAIVIGDGSTPTSPAAGSTRGRSAAWAPVPAMRSRRSSRTPTVRSCCCSATVRLDSPGSSSTRSRATA